MGGTLNNPSPRMDAAQYHAFAVRTLERMRSVSTGARMEVIPAYGRKPSFGDMDVVINYGHAGVAEANRSAVLANLHPTETCVKDNVTSVGVPADEHCLGFQVDLIEAEEQDFDFTLRFFSFNDLGNLMNRIANMAGFKLNQQGLHYLLRNPENVHHVMREIPITKDWDVALQLLGYSPEHYAAGATGGFESLEDIFTFVMSSPYASASTFFPENMDHASRIRDSKRPTYEAFLTWLDNVCDPTVIARGYDWSDRAQRQAEFLERVGKQLPHFAAALAAAKEEELRTIHAKKILGPAVVSRITDAWGKQLTQILREIDARFPSARARVDWILSSTAPERKALAKDAAETVKRRFASVHKGNRGRNA